MTLVSSVTGPALSALHALSTSRLSYLVRTLARTLSTSRLTVRPVITTLFRPKTPPIQLTTEPEEPLTGASSPPRSPSAARTGSPAPPPKSRHHSPVFDLNLARLSLALDIVSYALMALAHTGVFFTACSVLGAFGSGFGPSMSSVATALYTRNGGKELGKLFGALSVVQIVWCVLRHVGWAYMRLT